MQQIVSNKLQNFEVTMKRQLWLEKDATTRFHKTVFLVVMAEVDAAGSE
jgi:hypothetical protein